MASAPLDKAMFSATVTVNLSLTLYLEERDKSSALLTFPLRVNLSLTLV